MEPKSLTQRLKDHFRSTGKQNAVLGLSGGVDSALVLWLCVQALGPKNVFAYHLPYLEKTDDEKDANMWAGELCCFYEIVPIQHAADALVKSTQSADRIAIGNIIARTRMNALYAFARQHQALVVGTGNKSELLAGYFTKYGDGGVDVLPLGNVYKTRVFSMAKEVGVPESIISKTPTAGLWEGQTDEGEMGIRYEKLDQILGALIDQKMPERDAIIRFGKENVQLGLERNKLAKHKLGLPPVL